MIIQSTIHTSKATKASNSSIRSYDGRLGSKKPGRSINNLALSETNTIIVYDDDGVDVTPLPLTSPVAAVPHKKLGRGMDMMSSMAFGASVTRNFIRINH